MMDVTRSNFIEILPEIEKNIASCDFISIDTELSGLRKGSGGHFFDDHQERYEKIRHSCTGYSIIQFGMSCFTRQPKGNSNYYSSVGYNIYIFPYKIQGIPKQPDRNIDFQSSAVSFLRTHDFDFNFLFDNGLCYLTGEEEEMVKQTLQDQGDREMTRSMTIVPEEHREFIDGCVKKVDAFLEDKSAWMLDLETCNSFLRKLLYEALSGSQYRDKIDINTKKVSPGSRDCFLSITKASREEKAKKQENLLTEACGVSRILQSISCSRKPIVGHNLFLDILHCVGQFMTSKLPESYEEFKEMVHTLFPVLYDTKFISSTAALKPFITNNTLEELELRLTQEPFPKVYWTGPDGHSVGSTTRYHQAGYDAEITGQCFIIMNNFLQEKFDKLIMGASPIGPEMQRFVNRLNLTFSFDIDHYYFGGSEVKLDRGAVFHISFPNEWSGKHINQLLSPFGYYSIQWINDTSAFIGLKDPSKVSDFKKSVKNDSVVCVTPFDEFKMREREEKERNNSCKRSIQSLTPALKKVRVDNNTSRTSASSPSDQKTDSTTTKRKKDKTAITSSLPSSFEEADDW